MRRDHHHPDAEALGHGRRVQRPGSPEGEQGELAHVQPALDGDHADRVRHVLAGDLEDRERRVLETEREPIRERRDALGREVGSQLQVAAEEGAGVEPAEHEIRVRDRGGRPPSPVTRGAGHCTRARRADGEASTVIDVRDRRSPCADRLEVDHRCGDREAVLDLVLAAIADLAPADESDVRARSAHVEADDIAQSEPPGVLAPGDEAACEPGEHQIDRPISRRRRIDPACVRLEQLERRVDALGLERAGRLGREAADDRLQERIDAGRRSALELTPRRRDEMAEGDGKIGEAPAEPLADASFVLAVRERAQQVDRDGGRSGPSARRASISDASVSSASSPSAATTAPRRRCAPARRGSPRRRRTARASSTAGRTGTGAGCAG